jgi:RHS repeat-associated protein
VVANAYDATGTRVATTLPNGTQPHPENVNLLNAFNYVGNGGAELVDPYSPSTGARWWTPLNSTCVRDTTVSHSGSASFKVQATAHWTQSLRPVPPGAQCLLMAWVRGDGSGGTTQEVATLGVQTYQANGSLANAAMPTVQLGSSTAWAQYPTTPFSVPGDSQFARAAVANVTLTASNASGSPHAWFDDVALFCLSTSLRSDREGRSRGWLNMDGTSVIHVRDRFGRLSVVYDAKAQPTRLQWDALNRVVGVTDPLGNQTSFGWDANSNLMSVTDANTNVTGYAYDPLDRLTTITYPDTTTESFGYDLASNLTSYTNNRSQSRTLAYDNANRLTTVTYNTDSTTVQYTYDNVSNVLTRTERNGDVSRFSYDPLYRLVGVERDPAAGNPTQPWSQANTFDPVGNRIEFDCTAGGGQEDQAHYDQNVYGGPSPFWTAPNGYDALNRLTSYEDRLGNRTAMTYDLEGRLLRMSYPNGSPNPVTNAVYDIMGRLMSLDTGEGGTDLLPLQYGYDNNSNRRAQATGTDTFYYTVDAANRLVEESTNRWVDRTQDKLQQGAVSLLESNGGNVTLLQFPDTFSGTLIDFDRWRTVYGNMDILGYEVRQNNGLQMAWPRGATALSVNWSGGDVPYPYDPIATGYGAVWVGLENRMPLSGDFDVQVTFGDYNGGISHLIVADQPLESYTTGNYAESILTDSNSNSGFKYLGNVGLAGTVVATGNTTTTDRTGMLRVVRSGSTVTTYFWQTSSSTWVSLATYASFITTPVYVSLYSWAYLWLTNVAFTNFQLNSPSTSYATSGTYTSTLIDAGRSVTWDSIQWNAATPTGTAVQFQVAVSNSSSGPWTFVGPDGTSATYFTTPGTALHSGTTGQYACYQATLTGTGSNTPTLSRVDLLFGGTNASSEVFYTYDGAGNIVSKVTETPDAGGTVVTETRTFNNLNQLTQNVVNTVTTSPPSNTTVTWTYTWDASGNMHTKSDGTNLTTYTWDEDNRLTQVSLPGGATISYTYDQLGRMLTRTDSNGTTTFVWSSKDCVQETDYQGIVTRYYMPDGQLRSFDRQGTMYQVHGDALGYVRKVTDPTGTVVATYDFDAWGNQLASTSDSIPNGGLQYRFVGCLGVRWDSAIGLYYIRQRWYAPDLGRFISRDLLRSANAYSYVSNSPTNLVDVSGSSALQPGQQQTEFNQNLSFMKYLLNSPAAKKKCACDTSGDLGKVVQDLEHLNDSDHILVNDALLASLPSRTGPPSGWTCRSGSGQVYTFLKSSLFQNPAALLVSMYHEGYHGASGKGGEGDAYKSEMAFEKCIMDLYPGMKSTYKNFYDNAKNNMMMDALTSGAAQGPMDPCPPGYQ